MSFQISKQLLCASAPVLLKKRNSLFQPSLSSDVLLIILILISSIFLFFSSWRSDSLTDKRCSACFFSLYKSCLRKLVSWSMFFNFAVSSKMSSVVGRFLSCRFCFNSLIFFPLLLFRSSTCPVRKQRRNVSFDASPWPIRQSLFLSLTFSCLLPCSSICIFCLPRQFLSRRLSLALFSSRQNLLLFLDCRYIQHIFINCLLPLLRK